jgi:hypothetical protein
MKAFGGLQAKLDARTWVLPAVVLALFLLQAYAIRELLAAELLFLFALVVLAAFGAILYSLGEISQRGAHLLEAALRWAVQHAGSGVRDLREARRRWVADARAAHAHK